MRRRIWEDQNTCKYTDQSISKDRWEKFCVIIQVEQEGTGYKSEWVRQFLPVLFGHYPLFRIPIKWLSSSWCRFHICLEYQIESHVLIWGAGMTVLPYLPNEKLKLGLSRCLSRPRPVIDLWDPHNWKGRADSQKLPFTCMLWHTSACMCADKNKM